MGSHTLQITATVAPSFCGICAGAGDCFCRGSWSRTPSAPAGAPAVRVLSCAAGCSAYSFSATLGLVSVKPKTTYGWAWQNTYYKYGYLAGTIEAASLMADPIIEPENYSDDAAVTAARRGRGLSSATAESASTDTLTSFWCCPRASRL